MTYFSAGTELVLTFIVSKSHALLLDGYSLQARFSVICVHFLTIYRSGIFDHENHEVMRTFINSTSSFKAAICRVLFFRERNVATRLQQMLRLQ